MKYFLTALCLLFSTSMATASPKPTDFAYGMPLTLAPGGAVYRIEIPMDVYKTVTTNDLSDIRIFNAAQAVVPHILRLPETKAEISEKKTPLPLFPLFRDETSPEKNGLSVHIEKLENGTIVNIDDPGTASGKGRKLSCYILDAGNYTDRIDALDVVWPEDTKYFVTDISLEYSNDLTHWTSLIGRATLARMTYQGHEILKDRIELPVALTPQTPTRAPFDIPPVGHDVLTSGHLRGNLQAKYLRLSWPDDRDGIEVKEILAVQRSGEPEEKRSWVTLSAVPPAAMDSKKTLNREIATYEYDSAARLPVDRVQICFPEKNTLVKASLYSRSDPKSKWRFRQSGIFYHLNFDRSVLAHDMISPGRTSDRYWRLEVDGSASGPAKTAPKIKLGFRFHELLFVAQGDGPFMLAYGSARLGKDETKRSDGGLISRLIDGNEKTLLKEAGVTSGIVLGGPDRLLPEPPPKPWRDWLLWGVLVAGVAVIARMAFSLGKGIKNA